MQRNDPCWCGSGKKWKKCHYPVQSTPTFSVLREQYHKKYNIQLKDEKQIQGIKEACELTSDILMKTCQMAKKGVTTLEINDFAHRLCKDAGAIPAALNYGHPPFPKSICTSFNEVICHGIPDHTPIQDGDILNIDLALIYKGFYGDCSCMVTCGALSSERQLVVDVAYECLMRSIAILKPEVLVSAIGETIESYATSKGCSVVNQFVGHDVGVGFHENPQVPHCRNSYHIPLVPGMTFTIEPMINAGVREAVIDPHNHWEARTADLRASAQWEHTVLITETGHQILTTWTR
ncbi:MAG: methionyl aminopeptidase [Parachlamydiaceae bacterium]